ncbi:hypothetical protein GBF38_018930, partial [Nibea albiflora]
MRPDPGAAAKQNITSDRVVCYMSDCALLPATPGTIGSGDQTAVHVASMWGNQWHLCNLCHLLPSHCQVLLVPVTSPVSPGERVRARVSWQVGNGSRKVVADGSYVQRGL